MHYELCINFAFPRENNLSFLSYNIKKHAYEDMNRMNCVQKQIFLEKPAAINPQDLDLLCQELENNKTKSVMGLVLRFNPLSNLQKRLISEGELGNVFLANVDYWFGRERNGWMRQKKRSGGAFVLGGCHSVDLACYLLGTTITFLGVLPSIHLAENSCSRAIFSTSSFEVPLGTAILKRALPLNEIAYFTFYRKIYGWIFGTLIFFTYFFN